MISSRKWHYQLIIEILTTGAVISGNEDTARNSFVLKYVKNFGLKRKIFSTLSIFVSRWVERSLTSLRIPSLDEEKQKDDNEGQVGRKEEETDVERSKDEDTDGWLRLAKAPKPIILILLFLIILLLSAAGLAILLKTEPSPNSSQLTVSPLTTESSSKPQEEEYSTESTSQHSTTLPAADTDSSTLRRPTGQATTYFPDTAPRAGSRLLL